MKMDDLPNVYDLFFPSPPSLQELASIEIAISLWRRKIHQHITKNGILREWMEETELWNIIPDLGLPRNTELTIERYVIKLEEEIPSWVRYHRDLNILNFDVLSHFTNFVWDFDNEINYRGTARRFVTCKRISNEAKFRMACNYCLEDDIFRIWPEVSSHMRTNQIDIFHDSKVYYWVCRLKNQLHEMQRCIEDEEYSTIEDFVIQLALEDCYEDEWPTIEYFLNLLPLDARMKQIASIADQIDLEISYREKNWKLEPVFFRHILVKLNETLLNKFLSEKIDKLILLPCNTYVLNVWAYIKNKITNDVFCRIARHIMNNQSNESSRYEHTHYLYEIWITAPDYLKQHAIRNVLPSVDNYCIDRSCSSDQYIDGARRCVSFLSHMLSDASVEERREFWNEHWKVILIDIRPNDLYNLVKLCFGYDVNEVELFKEEALSKNQRPIFLHLKKLVWGGFFEELEKFLTFWFSNIETIEEVKKLLFL